MSWQSHLDQEIAVIREFTPSIRSVEHQQAGSGSVVTFSASITSKKQWQIYNESSANTVFYTLSGDNPQIQIGSGSANQPRPIAPGEKEFLYFPSGSYTLKCTARAVADIHLSDYPDINTKYKF